MLATKKWEVLKKSLKKSQKFQSKLFKQTDVGFGEVAGWLEAVKIKFH